MPFKVRVAYRDPRRRAEALWTMPSLFEQRDDGPRRYFAFGPAGAPVDPNLIAASDMQEVPDGSVVVLGTVLDQYGRPVYSQPPHTLN